MGYLLLGGLGGFTVTGKGLGWKYSRLQTVGIWAWDDVIMLVSRLLEALGLGGSRIPTFWLLL